MSQADQLFAENCLDILTNGVWDTGQEIRPRWEDGAPAHAVKKFCVINRYDLQADVRTCRWLATTNNAADSISEARQPKRFQASHLFISS